MAAPLYQTILNPTNFDHYLDEIGLGDLSPEARLNLVDKLIEGSQYAIVTQIFSLLNKERKLELVRLMKAGKETGDYQEMNDYLLEQIPDVEDLVDQVVETTKRRIKPGAASFQAILNSFLDDFERGKQLRGAGKDRVKDNNNMIGSASQAAASTTEPTETVDLPPTLTEEPAVIEPAVSFNDLMPPLPAAPNLDLDARQAAAKSPSSVEQPLEESPEDTNGSSSQALSDELSALGS